MGGRGAVGKSGSRAPALQRKKRALKNRYYKKEGPRWDRAFRYFVECENGYLAAAMDLAS